MSTAGYILRVIFPQRCALCGTLIEPTKDDARCFCPKCRSVWEQEKTSPCPVCRQTPDNCTCRLPYNKTRTLDGCRSLVTYESESVRKLIYGIKTSRDRALFTFISRELELLIFRKYDLSKNDIITAYPQRSRRARKKYGHDQAEIIAKTVSKDLGIPVFCGIKNSNGEEQKKLSGLDRGQNAYKSYSIPEKYRDQLKGKRVILIDDIVTTGATAVCSAALCKLYGASSVCCFCIAKTPRSPGRGGLKV